MSSTILPPRFEDRAAELDETFPVIPVYEEVSGSLRPTWIPVDPTTFIPPAQKKSRAKTFVLVATLGLLTWGVGFAAVVGGHAAMQRYDRRAVASHSQATEPTPTTAVTSRPSTPPSIATTNVATSSKATALGDSGIVLTVDVNDLPVIKNKPHGKSHATRGRDAGS